MKCTMHLLLAAVVFALQVASATVMGSEVTTSSSPATTSAVPVVTSAPDYAVKAVEAAVAGLPDTDIYRCYPQMGGNPHLPICKKLYSSMAADLSADFNDIVMMKLASTPAAATTSSGATVVPHTAALPTTFATVTIPTKRSPIGAAGDRNPCGMGQRRFCDELRGEQLPPV